ncbi:MAG: CoA:oxalate CoA-transferase [Gammaproteobacteria bacterium]|jgi:CoA:oxalate CoA-transferase
MEKSDNAMPTGTEPGVYSGVQVVDFSMFLAGPYCSRLMADMGATVIKVEPPSGDFLRAAPPKREGVSAYFGHLNCGKKSIALDLKRPSHVEVVRRLVQRADVVLENFRPGVMDRLGLSYEAVSELKPDVVYCSVSGYGQTGPKASRASFAPIIHAASGFEMLTPRYAPELTQPIANRNAMADYLAATHALAGIGAALFHRSRTGQGQHLDIALMDAMHNAMSYEYVDAQFPGQTPPTFRPMRTLDGYVAIAPVSEANFHALVRASEHGEWLSDPRFSERNVRIEHWPELLDTIETWTQTLTSAQAESALLREGCPASAYLTLAQAQGDEQVIARGAAVEVQDCVGPFRVANCPVQFSHTRASAGTHVPSLGEHTSEILCDLGYGPSDIEALGTLFQ